MNPEILAILRDNNLRDEEKLLILSLRYKFRFGEVIIMMRDGIVQRTLRAFESEELQHQNIMKKAAEIARIAESGLDT